MIHLPARIYTQTDYQPFFDEARPSGCSVSSINRATVTKRSFDPSQSTNYALIHCKALRTINSLSNLLHVRNESTLKEHLSKSVNDNVIRHSVKLFEKLRKQQSFLDSRVLCGLFFLSFLFSLFLFSLKIRFPRCHLFSLFLFHLTSYQILRGFSKSWFPSDL